MSRPGETVKNLTRALILGLLCAALLVAGACGGGGDSGGEVSSLEHALIGRWGRTAGAAALPDTLIFSTPPAAVAITGATQVPFTWVLAGTVLINNLGGQVNQATLTWIDGNHIAIDDLTAGSGPSSWERSP